MSLNFNPRKFEWDFRSILENKLSNLKQEDVFAVWIYRSEIYQNMIVKS